MAYATATELRENIDMESAGNDVVLENILEAATVSIDRACNRYVEGDTFFEAAEEAVVRLFVGNGKHWLRIDPCIEIETIETRTGPTQDYDTWTEADWLVYRGGHDNPRFNELPYTGVMAAADGDYSVFYGSNRGPTVRITARWGYSDSPPADIREACIMQAARWYKREQSSMADTMASGDLGTLLYRQALDPDIRRILVDGRYVDSVVYGL